MKRLLRSCSNRKSRREQLSTSEASWATTKSVGMWTILVHAETAGCPRLPIEAPRRHVGMECGLEGWDQLLKLVERQAREVQELHGAGLHIGKPYKGHGWCLLSWEAQH